MRSLLKRLPMIAVGAVTAMTQGSGEWVFATVSSMTH